MNRARATLVGLAALALWSSAPFGAAALDLGLDASAQSFGSKDYPKAGILPGLYARGGAIIGVASRLEIEPYVVAELAPEALRGLFAGAELTLPLLGPRETCYFNMFLSVGYARGLDLSGAEAGRNYLSLRLTPLAIGCARYGRRDRLFTPGVLYELEARSLTFTFNVLGFDFFAAPRPR